jgi:predicted HNH restriction endonuclease
VTCAGCSSYTGTWSKPTTISLKPTTRQRAKNTQRTERQTATHRQRLTLLPRRKKLRWHLRAERNPKLVRDAKRIHGSTCAVCGFNYRERYGELGEGYIEAHHITPFAELADRPAQLDPATDFAVLCASCHRIVHRRRPPYDLETIRDALK